MSRRLSTFFHLMRKDWRYIRWWAASCWIVTGIILVEPFLISRSLQMAELLALATVLGCVLLFVAQARLFQLDPVIGTTQFLATRPVPRTVLLRQKLLLWVLILILPCVLIRILHLRLTGMDLRVADYVLAMLQVLIGYLAGALACLVPAAYTRKLSSLIVFMAVGCMAAILLSGLAWSSTTHTPNVEPAYLMASRWQVLKVLFAAGATSVLYVLYRTGSRLKTIPVLAAVLLVSIAAIKWWPISFVSSLRRVYYRNNVSSVEHSRTPDIALTGVRTMWKTSEPVRQLSQISSRDSTTYAMSSSLTVHNLPPHMFLVPAATEWTAVSSRPGNKPFRHAGTRRITASADWPSLNLALPSPLRTDWLTDDERDAGEPVSGEVEVFSVTSEKLQEMGNEPVDVTGRVQFTVYQSLPAASAPVEEGRRLSAGRLRCTIRNVEIVSGTANVGIVSEHVGLGLLGEPISSGMGYLQDYIYLARTGPDRSECARASGPDGEEGFSGFIYGRWRSTWRFARHPNPEGPSRPIAPEWLKEAELSLFRMRKVGEFTCPFEFKDLRLKELLETAP